MAFDDVVAELLKEIGELRRELAVQVRENFHLRELLKAAGDRMLAVVAPMERTAKATEDIASANLNEIREFRLALQDLAKSNQSIAKDVDDVQREVTGAHPLAPLEVDDTDKAIGKLVRGVFKRGWVRLATTAAGGLGLGGALHWLIDHLTKGK